MSRYVKGRSKAQSGGWVEDEHFSAEAQGFAAIEVDETIAVDTGLVWATGEPIMRTPNPVGFGRDEDW